MSSLIFKQNKIKVLLTGGSGFIGTNLSDWLIKNNIVFINIDINQPKIIDHRNYWENIDMRNCADLMKIVKKFKPTHVLHLAADLGMDHRNLDNLQCNITGIDNLIEAVKSVNSVQRIIFVSSLLVCKNGYIPNNDTDYCPPNYYGESKVIGEKKVRSSKLPCEWAIVRPTSIWGPWFDYSYKQFFQAIDNNRYMHITKNEFEKPACFVGNAVHMLAKILFEKNSKINKGTFYIADFPWYSTKKWANTIQNILNSKKIITAPFWLLKFLARGGDLIKIIFRFDPPLTTFRLNNMMTGGSYHMDNTKEVVGELPYDLNESVYLTSKWMYEKKMIKHKPKKI